MNFNVLSPRTTEELLAAISELQGKRFRFGAGGTDLYLEIKKNPVEDLTIINLAQLNDDDFTSIVASDSEIKIGTMVTAHRIASDGVLRRRFPVLSEAAFRHGSRQIRQVATVGGNLCTASPAGDMACALVALGVTCEVLSAKRTVRTIPIDKFFMGVRKTDLRQDEVLRAVIIPVNHDGKVHSGFVKVGTRRSMECAVVSLAYHIPLDEFDQITNAGIAIGSAAPTIKFVTSACDYLIGKKMASLEASDCNTFAEKVLEYASPISDIRGSAWYRKEVLYNISKSMFENQAARKE
jgi:CO/xanthine dehydrogenase FAD-binding subunit